MVFLGPYLRAIYPGSQQSEFALTGRENVGDVVPQYPVKLLIYSPAFWPQVGGVESIGMTLAMGLAAESVNVTVVTRTAPGSAPAANFPFQLVRRPPLAQLFRLMRESDLLHLAGPAMLPMALAV